MVQKSVNGVLVDLTSDEQSEYNAKTSSLNVQKVILSALAAHRYNTVNGGTIVSGVPLLTDSDSRSDLMAAYIMATANSGYSVNWKTPSGFVTLNASTIIAIGNAVAAFVQKCFDTEASLIPNVANYSTPAAIIGDFDRAMAS